jgi:hypothetical protein
MGCMLHRLIVIADAMWLMRYMKFFHAGLTGALREAGRESMIFLHLVLLPDPS